MPNIELLIKRIFERIIIKDTIKVNMSQIASETRNDGDIGHDKGQGVLYNSFSDT